MFLNYEPEKLEELSRDFLIATGIELGVCDENFKPLNFKKQNGNRYCAVVKRKEVRRLACRRSDRALLAKCREEGKAVMHVCHAGLIDLALPIMYREKIIAYLILGQIRVEETFPALRESVLFSQETVDELQKIYDELPIFDQKKLKSISKLAMMTVKYILFENMLMPKYNPSFDRALSFINENLYKNLSILEISKAAIIPKSSLYKLFHTHFGCTVNEYINSKRIEEAERLLTEENFSVEEISERLGFSTQQYFSKLFKKAKGVSPAQFRKNNH
ncbi:MAG: PocR ligand-binding domain-containing protein [Oscillospiraceae bacterium]|nr:PocR ligand-binding domain-containing protein [Oscillospiraceae bacterium]